jgi:cellulose biosynthesis protein BcsQ
VGEDVRVGKVVAVVNQKGGVGKTTVAVGLASAARARGHKVLVVDLDPQGASTWVLGVDAERVRTSAADALGSSRGGSLRDVIVPTTWGHLVDVAPSGPGLQRHESSRTGLETWLTGKSAVRLRRALEGVSRGYGIVLVDCPPSLGDLTTNALAAADLALLVVEPTALSLRGVAPVADLIETVWDRHNQRLDLAGVIVNRMPARGSDAQLRYDELARTVGTSAVWQPAIPARIAVAEAASARRPLHDLGARGRDVADVFARLYGRLWKLVKPPRA